MRAYPRSKVAAFILLCVGLLLGQAILGCHNRITLTPTPPQAMALSLKAGDIVEWKLPDPKPAKDELVIPDGVCALTPAGKHSDEYHVTVVQVSEQGVKCKVLKKPKGSGPLTYFYKYNFATNREAMAPLNEAIQVASSTKNVASPEIAPPLPDATGVAGGRADAKYDFEKLPPANATGAPSGGHNSIMLLQIAGSCGGCDKTTQIDKDTDSAIASATTPQPTECVQSKAHVTDNNGNYIVKLTVPKELSNVDWIAQGTSVTLTFDLKTNSGTPLVRPCTNGTLSGDTLHVPGSECKINDAARTADTTYPYNISISNCASSDYVSLILNKK